jgi:alternate signal-mediated exported protein
MNKATKGALAAMAAGVLVTGGAGSLAYWTGSNEVDGANIQSGEITMGDPDCTGTPLHEWELNGQAFTAASYKIIPGDELVKVCEFTLTLAGNNIGADLTITQPTYTTANALTAELAADAVFTVDGVTETHLAGPDTYTVRATVTVPFTDSGVVDNDANAAGGFTAALENVVIKATQAPA